MEEILTTTKLIVRACQENHLDFTPVSADHEVIQIHFPHFDQLVVNSDLGLISSAEAKICLDKGYQEELLRNVVKIPYSQTYLDPNSQYVDSQQGLQQSAVVTAISQHFDFPLIVKKNHGRQGQATYLCQNQAEVEVAVAQIFSHHNWEYDHVLLAQQYIKPRAEYRAVFYQQRLEILYLKDISRATFAGNLSPLHYLGARAVDCVDKQLRATVQNFVQPVFNQFNLKYAGFDVIVDQNNQWWLIEINSAPGFTLYARDNSPEKVVKLFSKILTDFQHERQPYEQPPLANL